MEDDDFDSPITELPGDELDIDLDAGPPEDEETAAAGWRGRKQRRYDTFIQENNARIKELGDELKQEREARQRLENEHRNLREFAEQFDDPTEDQYETRLEQLDQERQEIQQTWAGLTPEAQKAQLNDFSKRMRANEAARMDVHADRRAAARERERGQVNPALEYQRSVMYSEYGDVFKDQKASMYADAYWKQQVALGRDDTLELKKEAAQAAREQFKTSTKRGGAPTATQKRKYSGGSAGSAGPAGGNVVRLSKTDRMMADARFPDLPEAKRYKAFAEIKKRSSKTS